jgi:GTP:adenosylcobinamide-phosphate guanylyltransferase
MEKQTIALLLARGTVSKPLALHTSARYKALLSLNGSPLVDYILRALCESDVEKVFIVHRPDNPLDEIVTKNTKNVFLSCDRDATSYASTVISGAEKIIDYYGLTEIHRRTIMVVPCDIPLVKKENFNALMEANQRKNADFVMPFINIKYLSEKYPERRFRSFYLTDLNGKYALQNISFFNGRIFDMIDYKNDVTGRLAISGAPDLIRDMAKAADRLYRHRQKAYQISHIVYEFLSRLARKRHLLYGLKFIYNLYSGEITSDQISYAFSTMLDINFGIIESRETEFSGDIDLPEHLEAAALRFAGGLQPEPAYAGNIVDRVAIPGLD